MINIKVWTLTSVYDQALKTGQLPADLLIPEDDTAVAATTVNEEDSNQMDIDDTTSKSLDKSKRNEEPRKTDSPISIDAVSFQYNFFVSHTLEIKSVQK